MQWGMLHSFAIKAKANDYLESYQSPTWDDVPDKFKDPDGKWYGWSYWFNLLAVNTDILEKKGLDMPQSWEDLLDPQYKGEIVLPDPGTSGTAFLFVSTIMQIMGEEKGWEYLKKLDENVAQYTKSGTAPAQMVAQGEYAIGITWDQAVFERIEEGYPLEAVFPSEGVGYSLDVVWMFKDANNKDKVKKIIDYIGSEKGMKLASEHRSMEKLHIKSSKQSS
jgi:iron(III) transport system substrate-binding protein